MKKHTVHHHTKKHTFKNKLFWLGVCLFGIVLIFGVFFIFFFTLPSQVAFKGDSKPLVFVLPGQASDWGLEAPVSGTHGAASQRDYLFSDSDTSSLSGSGTSLPSTSLPSTSVSSTSSSTSSTIVGMSDSSDEGTPLTDKDGIPLNTSSSKDGLSIDNGSQVQFDDKIGTFTGQKDIPQPVVVDAQVCTTPWGDEVAPGDFILGYQQRSDVNTLCSVEKRYCIQGKLSGSFTGQSCDDTVTYTYEDNDVVSYNTPKDDPFIQPGDPRYSGANFDIHGKRDGKQNPIDLWPAGKSTGKSKTITYVSQTSTKGAGCTSPRGEKVTHGHFVKAYKAPLGLIDMPCEVELRLCVDGVLKGYFANRTCTFKNMTYRDYLVGNTDVNSPTVGDMMNTVSSDEQQLKSDQSSFWDWLDTYF